MNANDRSVTEYLAANGPQTVQALCQAFTGSDWDEAFADLLLDMANFGQVNLGAKLVSLAAAPAWDPSYSSEDQLPGAVKPAEPKPVALTVSKMVASVEVTWAEDDIVDGPGGPGWRYASFDALRPGTARVTFADGSRRDYPVTTDDDHETSPTAGHAWPVACYPFDPHAAAAAAIGEDDIPF